MSETQLTVCVEICWSGVRVKFNRWKLISEHLRQSHTTNSHTYPHVGKTSGIFVYTELRGSVDGDSGDSVVVDEVIEAEAGLDGAGVLH